MGKINKNISKNQKFLDLTASRILKVYDKNYVILQKHLYEFKYFFMYTYLRMVLNYIFKNVLFFFLCKKYHMQKNIGYNFTFKFMQFKYTLKNLIMKIIYLKY